MGIETFLEDEAASPFLVSILIPIYNVEKYLEETIRSISQQTYREIEIVLLDDGSQDSSMQIASRLAAEDSRIVILPARGQNRGVVATRNDLLRAARGAYIAWNDSDDVSAADRIEKQVNFLRAHPEFGAVGTGITYADQHLVAQHSESYPADPERQRTDPYLCCATVMATREAARDAGPFRDVFRHGGEDGDWILKMSDKHNVTNIAESLYTYRRHPRSLTHNFHNWALTVRIGVFARYAARRRRLGHRDPVDALHPTRLPEQLNAWSFLDNTSLTHEEVLTSLSRRLGGEAPALSILHGPIVDDKEMKAIVAGYEAQSFGSFEVLIPAKVADLPRLAAIANDAKATIKVIALPADNSEKQHSVWETLIDVARGRYLFMLTKDNAPPPPWAVYEFVRICLKGRDSDQKTRIGDTRWITVSGDDLRQGVHHRLTMNADEARDTMRNLTNPRQGLIVEASADSRFISIWFRAKAVHRNKGTIGVLRAIAQNCKRLLKHGICKIVYVWVGPRVVNSRFGKVTANSRVIAVAKRKLRDRLNSVAPEAAPEPRINPLPVVSQPSFSVNYAAAAAKAKLKVGVYECWGDFPESLHYLTAGGTGLSCEVMFAPMEHVEEPDFILVLNTPGQEKVTASIAPERLWFAIGEPPTPIHRPLHRGQGERSTIVTCDFALPDGTAPGRRYIHAPVMTRTWHVKRSYDELSTMGPMEKPKALSWVTSNLRILDGHRYRMQFLEKLRDRVQFDLFGRGFNAIDDKWDAIAPYRYSIAFENIVAPLYFTEKLMDCFVCQTMPFYFGDPDIEKRFPAKSMIRFDPEDPKVFDMIRDVSASDLWKERQAEILEARDLVLNKYNMYRVLAEQMRQAAETPPSKSELLIVRRQTVL